MSGHVDLFHCTDVGWYLLKQASSDISEVSTHDMQLFPLYRGEERGERRNEERKKLVCTIQIKPRQYLDMTTIKMEGLLVVGKKSWLVESMENAVFSNHQGRHTL